MENDRKHPDMDEVNAHHGAKAKEIRESILAGYKTIVDNISSTHFQAIQNVITAETGKTVEFDKAVKIFKAKLYGRIESKFLANWNEIELDKSIVHLEFSKAQTTDDEKKWRPTNHSVEEQFRPAIIRELSKRKNLLQRQLNFQNGVIEELVVALEQYRQQMKEQSHNRQHIIAHSEQDSVALTNVEDQLATIHEVINSNSTPMDKIT